MGKLAELAEQQRAELDEQARTEAKAKAKKMQKVADNARELTALAAHPLVQEYFERLEQQYTQEMITADPSDDDARRGAACMLKAVRDLKAMLSTGERVARKAEEEYAQLISKTDEG